MEPYERIIAAVHHKCPDRIPIDYTATPETHAMLKKHLGIDDNETLLRKLGVDIRRVGPHFIGPKDVMGVGGWRSCRKRFLRHCLETSQKSIRHL